MAPEMLARDGFVGGVQPLDLRESGERRSQVGRIDGTRLIMMRQMPDFASLG